MSWSKLSGILVCAAALLLGDTTLSLAGDPYPSRPIRIVVPVTPGGGIDLTTRLVARKMSERLGQPVIVDNRPGADTMLGTKRVKDADPDGYTLLAQANGLNITTHLHDDIGIDPQRDFTGIGWYDLSPFVMEVSSERPDRTVADFIARAKANPGKLTYGHGGVGAAPQISAALFLLKAGLDVTPVPYKGNGAALIDVAGGRVDMIFAPYISSAPYVSSGKLRPLAVTSIKRIPTLPDVPTFQEAGVDYSYTLWMGLLAPAKTPKEVIAKLSDALHYAIEDKEVAARMQAEGSDPAFVAPEDFNAYLARENAEMIALIKQLNLGKE